MTIQPENTATKVWVKGSTALSGKFAAVSGEANLWVYDYTAYPGGAGVPADPQPQTPLYEQDVHNLAGCPLETEHLEMLFVNGKSYRQELRGQDRDHIDAGEFYVDPVSRKVYVRTTSTVPLDDAANVVELAQDSGGLRMNVTGSGGAKGSRIVGINFAQFTGTGLVINSSTTTVSASAGHISVDRCVFAWNALHGMQVMGGGSLATPDLSAVDITNCRFVANGKNGLVAGGMRYSRIYANTFEYNNAEDFSARWEAAGAKISNSRDLDVFANTFQYNYCKGLWFDVNCRQVDVVRNIARYNIGNAARDGDAFDGIKIELCGQYHDASNAIIHGRFGYVAFNTVYGHIFGTGIEVSDSWNVEIWNNTIARNFVNLHTGDGGRDEDTGNLIVHNNLFSHALSLEWDGTPVENQPPESHGVTDDLKPASDPDAFDANWFDADEIVNPSGYVKWLRPDDTNSPHDSDSNPDVVYGTGVQLYDNKTTAAPTTAAGSTFEAPNVGDFRPDTGVANIFGSGSLAVIAIPGYGSPASGLYAIIIDTSDTTGQGIRAIPNPTNSRFDTGGKPKFAGAFPVGYEYSTTSPTFSGTERDLTSKVSVTIMTGTAATASRTTGRAVVVARDTNDTVTADVGPGAVLFARLGDGADTLLNPRTGSSGPTVVDGDGGNDALNGGLGPDYLAGGTEEDTLVGGAGGDFLIGDYGKDTILGGTGDDTLGGGKDPNDGSNSAHPGRDSLDAGDATDSDMIYCAYRSESEPIIATVGDAILDDDLVSGYEGIIGGDGNDLLTGRGGTTGNDTLVGQSGAAGDTLMGLGGADSLIGGAKRDSIVGGNENDTIEGGSGFMSKDDEIGPGDIIDAGLGADLVYGGKDDDTIDGGNGSDTLFGGPGTDLLTFASLTTAGVTIDLAAGTARTRSGTDWRDVITDFENVTGGSGADSITGDTLDNVIDGGPGQDTLKAGGGSDTVSYASYTVNVRVSLDGLDNDGATTENETLEGFENITGGSGNDTLTGDTGVNSIQGGMGDDSINGGDGDDLFLGGGMGDDTVRGGNGADTVVGGMGTDSLYGEGGDDTLYQANTTNATATDGSPDRLDGGGGTDTAFAYTVLGPDQDSVFGVP